MRQDDPQKIQHLRSGEIERDERILKWQQFKNVAKRQGAFSDDTLAQTAAISDCKQDGLPSFRLD